MIQSLYPPAIPHATTMRMVAIVFHGTGRLTRAMTMRNGVIIIALANVTMSQYHLDVKIARRRDRASRMDPIRSYGIE